MTPKPAAAVAMRPTTVVLVLTLLLGIQPITTDLYLPALPALAGALGAGMGAAQLTLSALIICFGVAQLAWGPLSDRFGRRPVLLAGLALYCVAGLGASLAPSIAWLIAWRALQGAGMAAAVTCGRSIVRDLYEPREGARVMSRALAGLGVLAMLGPLLGGTLVHWLHWRATLAAVTLFGVVALAAVVWHFTETLPRRNPRATQLAQLAANWQRILRHPTFIAWTALQCATWGGLFTMLASSSFIFIDVLGASQLAYGAVLASCSLSYIFGTFVCRFLLRHGNASQAVAIGAVFSLGGGTLLAGLSLAGVQSMTTMVAPLLLYGVGHGIHQPCSNAGAISPFPEAAGTAASLAGFAMMVTAFVVSLVLGRVMNGTVYPLTLGVGVFSVCVAVIAWTLVRRHGDRRVLAPGAQPA
jgi:DHA1 family bicyclomycin/chloramphenicol resistance-like MFS transporter